MINTKLIRNLSLIIFASFLFAACSSNNQQIPNNYNNQGYQYQPPIAQQPPVRQDGYYYNAPPMQQSGYYGGYYGQPSSRYYSNPYAVNPQNQYPYYDGDQYYVPPTSYGVVNRDNNIPVNQKF